MTSSSRSENKIVLIKRKNPPFGWALPGGFVDYGESFEDAAVREAYEETGLQLKQISDSFIPTPPPDVIKRMHTASTVFIAQSADAAQGRR